ncbi:hypothetical protein OQA88_9856 [Cercophora sp. LCS_1]
MDTQTKAQYEAQSQELRVQLKAWENDWAKSHDGSKPSRNDIKQNPDIALKYKQYNKFRDIIAGKTSAEAPVNSHKRKPSETLPPATPSKRPRPTQTPRKSSQQHLPADLPGPPAEITTPTISRQLFSPAVPTSIGPTPQRDGRVLGLFDLLAQTPSHSNSQQAATPSSRRSHRIDKTPVTGSRFRHIAGMTTPLNEGQGNGPKKTPSTGGSGRVSKLQFATPAFLRRRAGPPLDVVDENGEWKVGPLRLPKKPLGRSLSSVVAGLRKMEEEAADDELDALREMEMEAEGIVGKPVAKPPAAAAAEKKPGGVEVGDSQVVSEPKYKPEKPVLLGGFDDENIYDSSEEEQLDRGQPLRVYKKKGQKRTTRRSNLKPTRMKRPAMVAGEQDGSGEDDDDVVPETQFDTTKVAENDDNELRDELQSGSDFDGQSSEEEEEVAKKKMKKTKTVEKPEAKKKEGVVTKAVRKVKATAHANFKRLKLKNTGSKGGPAHNSRFRRRR